MYISRVSGLTYIPFKEDWKICATHLSLPSIIHDVQSSYIIRSLLVRAPALIF